MTVREIERVLSELERVTSHITGLADRMEPQRTRGLCIGASRIALLGLREVGLRADALAVRVVATSPAHQQMMDEAQRNGRHPTTSEVLDWRERGAWAVVIGPQDGTAHDANDHGFYGHVIVSVERRWILDLTLGQASRPSHGIPLPPTTWAECPPLARGEAAADFDVDGVLLSYEPIDDRSYLTAHDWTNLRPGELSVRNLAKRLRAAAAGDTPPPLRTPLVGVRR